MTSDSIQSYTASPATIILTTVLLVLFFLAFFSLYLCRCVLYWLNLRRTHGVDESTMKKFPTFTYSQVKDLRVDKSNLECAICLSEFLDDDLLRLLTTCRHVFHQKCIDVWLESNNTCPVCRGSLDEPGKSPAPTGGATNGNQEMGGSFSISIEEEDGGRHVGPGAAPPPSIINLAEQSDRNKQYWVKQFWRSHSTGHSVLRGRNIQEERYVLRLPQHSQTKLLGKQNWTRSRTTFRESESRKYIDFGFGFGFGFGFEEVSDIRDPEANIV